MKYLLTLILLLGINFLSFADEQDVEHTHENDFENGCDNDLDDDMDGNVDEDDEDCKVAVLLDSSELSPDVKNALVWGVGIALLSAVDGSSGTNTGTATND